MTNLIVVAVLVVIVVGAVAVYLAVRGPSGPSVATYNVSGYVKTDGTALPGATVTIGGKSAVTASNGYYEITGLEGNKSYTLTVSMTGYESSGAAVSVGSQDVQVTDISLKTAGVVAPLTAIMSALAGQENVLADNVELYFCDAAFGTDNYAIGAVVNRQTSIVFFYSENTGIITENRYTATGDALIAMATLCQKQVLSKFPPYHRIVPFNFTKKGAVYSFNYFDGYYGLLQRWGFGIATLDANGNVPAENMTHT